MIHHPKHGDFKMPSRPVRVDGAPLRLLTSPMLGEHNAQVLGDWLGIGAAEVESLRQEGMSDTSLLRDGPTRPDGGLLFFREQIDGPAAL